MFRYVPFGEDRTELSQSMSCSLLKEEISKSGYFGACENTGTPHLPIMNPSHDSGSAQEAVSTKQIASLPFHDSAFESRGMREFEFGFRKKE